jgi:epoxyqueuosine reductase
VCPYNHGSSSRRDSDLLGFRPELAELDLLRLLELGSADYRKLVRRSALRRVNRTTLQRNAAIALGNSDDARAVAPLCRALESNRSALVRLHVAWALAALGRHLDAAARTCLQRAADSDEDPEVRSEARRALAAAVPAHGAG